MRVLEVVNINRSALWEATKELLRYLCFVFIAYFLAKLGDFVSYFGFSTATQVEVVFIATAFLRWLDKYLHEKWRIEYAEKRMDIETKPFKGLTPF